MSDVALTATCPSCGEPAAAGDAFCEACGAPLSGDAAAVATAAVEPGPTPEPEPEPQPAGGNGDLLAKGLAAAAVARATARSAPAPEQSAAAAPPAATGGDPGSEDVVCRSCGTQGQWFDGYCGVCGAKRPHPRDHTELEGPGVAAVSDKGLRHAKNEDSYAVTVADGFVVAVVCDGVSTTVLPEVASQAAADAAAAVLSAGGPAEPQFDAAFDAARAAVLAVEFQPHPSLGPPSCTYLASVVTDSSLRLSAFGDCRGYWISADGAVRQLTVDDSWAAQQIAAGMDPSDAYADNRAHAITRWLARDADPSWRPVQVTFDPPGAGRVLLVSDGVWNYAAESDQLAAVVAGAPGPGPLALARHLVDYANRQGGADNITAVVVDLPLQPGDGPRPPEAP
ncbi:MAG: protein phosphatase 2C domain-containing protein [Acidimicrobiia bacterium]